VTDCSTKNRKGKTTQALYLAFFCTALQSARDHACATDSHPPSGVENAKVRGMIVRNGKKRRFNAPVMGANGLAGSARCAERRLGEASYLRVTNLVQFARFPHIGAALGSSAGPVARRDGASSPVLPMGIMRANCACHAKINYFFQSPAFARSRSSGWLSGYSQIRLGRITVVKAPAKFLRHNVVLPAHKDCHWSMIAAQMIFRWKSVPRASQCTGKDGQMILRPRRPRPVIGRETKTIPATLSG